MNEIIHPQEISEVLGISRSTVLRWIDEGLIPGHRTAGGHRRVLRKDFMAATQRLGLPLLKGESLPLAGKEDTEEALAAVAEGKTGGVIAVDDNREHLVALQLLLERAFPDVPFKGVNRPFQAGLIISQLHPRVLLLDLQMPGLDGTEVCRLVRELPGGQDIHIAAVTAHVAQEDRIAAFCEAGGEKVFPKPFNTADLIDYVKSCLCPAPLSES